MSTDQKRAIVFCLSSEIDAFAKELERRGGPKRDWYGNPVFDGVLAYLRLLEGARTEVIRIKVAS